MRGLIAQIKAADPDCCWFFDRLVGSAGPAIGLWAHSAPEVLQRAVRRLSRLRTMASRQGVWLIVGFRDRRVSFRSPSGRDIRDELSAASSDFAVRLLADTSRGSWEQFALAVAHLRCIVALVPQEQQLPFLFQCWQHWAAVLSPRARVDCAPNARLAAGSIVPGPAETGAGDIWRSYQRSLSQIVSTAGAGTGVPVNYLLFDHAHRTHSRLGIQAATEALAVRVVRSEHAARQRVPESDPSAASLPGAVPMLNPA
jgi:hypothetical protein